ncbi:MAG: hypothetical protein Q4D80_03670 [Pseudomonadota bacterium]|nr:hypothetical protein [Pseudomonadota bacterium]
MEKISLLGMFLVLTGCTAYKLTGNVNSPAEEAVFTPETVPAALPVSSEINMPCSYSCADNNCSGTAAAPLVLKPRVTETYSEYKKQRDCPDDVPVAVTPQSRIPDLPEIYVISANRTVNSMLSEAQAVFQDKTINVYIQDTRPAAADLPGGTAMGVKTIRKRLADTATVLVVDDAAKADYVVKSAADWFDTPTKQVPAIKYTLVLESKDGIKIGEWAEVVHQAEGDRSWW